MASKFSQIAVGEVFEAKGAKYRKADDLYIDDLGTGFQIAWSPMFDKDIVLAGEVAPTPVANAPEFIVNPQSREMVRNPEFGKEHPAVTTMKKLGEILNIEPNNYEEIVAAVEFLVGPICPQNHKEEK